MAKLVPSSRLRFGEYVSVGGVEFWDLVPPPEIPETTEDVFVTVQPGDRLDLIAHRYYSDPTLWWVIAAANGIDLAPTQVSPGDVLRIPSASYVNDTLFRKATV